MIYENLSQWSADTALPKAPARSSSSWQPNGSVPIPSAAAAGGTGYVSVGPNRPGRKTIIVSNIGTNAATLSNSQNPNTLGVLLGVGAVWGLDTEGEVWCRSQLGTVVDVVEFYTPITDPGKIPFYGRAGY